MLKMQWKGRYELLEILKGSDNTAGVRAIDFD